jgi:hydrogenase-4 component F
VLRAYPLAGGLFLMSALAVTGMPPFSLFQSEFLILSGGLSGGHEAASALLIAGLVTIFAGFLRHASRMNLGTPPSGLPPAQRCRWTAAAMVLAAGVVLTLAFWLPAPLFELARQASQIVQGTP